MDVGLRPATPPMGGAPRQQVMDGGARRNREPERVLNTGLCVPSTVCSVLGSGLGGTAAYATAIGSTVPASIPFTPVVTWGLVPAGTSATAWGTVGATAAGVGTGCVTGCGVGVLCCATGKVVSYVVKEVCYEDKSGRVQQAPPPATFSEDGGDVHHSGEAKD